MDIPNCISIVYDKIQSFEPDLAMKIMSNIFKKDNCKEELVRLASCPDQYIREMASKAKTEIQMSEVKTEIQMSAVNPALPPISQPAVNPQQSRSHFSLTYPRTAPSSSSFQAPSPYWDPQSVSIGNPKYMATNYLDSIAELQIQAHLLSLENHHIDPVITSAVNVGGKADRRFSSSSDTSVKICHHFNKGYCRNGLNCRYSHAQPLPEGFSQMQGNGAANEDQAISPGSVAQLESEIIELLKQRRGSPMSIASLPSIYYDKYKKVLTADGYLTESQRHGRTGYSLTKLLVRLPGICLIDRPHGQHAVVLAEDAHKYIQKHISASRQLYMTFPDDSTFSEDDVADYFNTFGSVADVRIPCQHKRMYGFVTFTDPEPVKVILDKGNPHYISGSRVLVKPYREKVIERKHQDITENSIGSSSHHSSHHYDSDLNSISSHVIQSTLRRQLIEEQEKQAALESALEFERRRFAQLQQITRRPLPPIGVPINEYRTSNVGVPVNEYRTSNVGVSINEYRTSNGYLNFQPTEPSSSTPLNGNFNRDSSDGNAQNSNRGFNILDSPFTFQIHSDYFRK